MLSCAEVIPSFFFLTRGGLLPKVTDHGGAAQALRLFLGDLGGGDDLQPEIDPIAFFNDITTSGMPRLCVAANRRGKKQEPV